MHYVSVANRLDVPVPGMDYFDLAAPELDRLIMLTLVVTLLLVNNSLASYEPLDPKLPNRSEGLIGR